jgi:hypothetical protein
METETFEKAIDIVSDRMKELEEIKEVIKEAKELSDTFPLRIRKRSEMVAKICTEYKKSTDFIEGVVWADTHPDWISVEDEKPEPMENVFLYAKGWSKPFIGKLLRCGDHDEYLNEDCSTILDEVTHWMPRPKAPKTEEEEEGYEKI